METTDEVKQPPESTGAATTPPAPEAPGAPETPTIPEPVKPSTAILLEKIHDITPFVSTDSTRLVLHSLHYNAKGNFIEACDGRILIRVPVTAPIEEFPKVSDKSIAKDSLIPSEPFKKALSNMPKNGPLKILHHVRVGMETTDGVELVNMTTTDLDTEQSVKARAFDGAYPDTEQVLNNKPAIVTVALADELICRIAEYAKKHGKAKGAYHSIVFEFTDEKGLDPIRFSTTVENAMLEPVKVTGVLMSMRQD